MVGKLVVCYQVASNGFTVIGTKELCGSVPELTVIVWRLFVEFVFKGCITLAQDLVKFKLVAHAIEIERIARTEDNDLLGEVSIMRVVEAIWRGI